MLNSELDYLENISTHSLTRRLTDTLQNNKVLICYFNSQPHKEADTHAMTIDVEFIIFQLTASQGG